MTIPLKYAASVLAATPKLLRRNIHEAWRGRIYARGQLPYPRWFYSSFRTYTIECILALLGIALLGP
jgi:hypothetical protein